VLKGQTVLSDEKKLPKAVMDGLGKLLYGKAADRTRSFRTVGDRKTGLTSNSTFRRDDEETHKSGGFSQTLERDSLGETTVQIMKTQSNPQVAQEHILSQLYDQIEEAKESPKFSMDPHIAENEDESHGSSSSDDDLDESKTPGEADTARESETPQEKGKLKKSDSSRGDEEDPTDVPKLSYIEEQSSVILSAKANLV